MHEFQKIDLNGNGYIESDELVKAIQDCKERSASDKEIKNIISQLDLAQNGKINYSEFLSATINLEQVLTKERISALFNSIDVDHSGKISRKNIVDAFTKFGREVTQEELNTIMGEHDEKKSGDLDHEEFRNIF